MNFKYLLFIIPYIISLDIFANLPIVIAHRGAPGYLPEHTLAAQALAYAMKPDYLEQDVVMTKDNQLIVTHDIYLDRTTDVANKFPNRSREDGHYYAIDFTLEEIKTLKVTESFYIDDENSQLKTYPERFPLWQSDFKIATLSETIELVQGLNETLGYDVGIYPEIKAVWFHQLEGRDISLAVLNLLNEYGYNNKNAKIYLQLFDFDELKRIKEELMPKLNMDINLIQLLAYTDWNETMVLKDGLLVPYNYDWMFKPEAMKEIAIYADGIGPWKSMLIDEKQSRPNNIILSPLIEEAKAAGLQVHAYTFRADSDNKQLYAQNFNDLLNTFYYDVEIDGYFTDFPDKVVEFIDIQSEN